MKQIIATIALLAFAGSAFAGCGVKVPVNGELTSYDAEKKALKVGDQTITLAADASVTDAEGKKAKIEDLVGKKLEISTDKHTKKAESVKVAKAS